ncbi:MAG: hypothetical protein JO318_17970 [Chloroflexi bacterium]|nr:hypothetical protein [Chloroflexota bacterium]
MANDVYVHLYVEARNGYDGLDPSGGYVFYAHTLVIALGWPLLLASIAGAALSAWRRHWPSLVVLSLPVAMLGVLGSQQLYFARFALPVLPALIVQASLALDALLGTRQAARNFESEGSTASTRAHRRTTFGRLRLVVMSGLSAKLRGRQAVVGALAVAIAAVPTVADAVRFDSLMTRTDTRTLAAQWLPASATYAADAPPLGPPLPQGRNLATDGAALYDVSPDTYRGRGVEYLVVSSFTADAHAIDPGREAKRLAFNTALAAEPIVAQLQPGDIPFNYDQVYGPYTDLDRLERPGPKITIYRLTPSAVSPLE